VTRFTFAHFCPVCGRENRFVELYRKSGYPIGRCEACGLGATQAGADFDPSSIYDASYFKGDTHDGYAGYGCSERVLRRDFRRVLKRLTRCGCDGGRLLEIGCAYGFFLLEAQRRFEVRGVELSAHAAEACRSRGLEVHCGSVEDGCLKHQDPFDAAVMLDVIEHVEDPGGTLHAVREVLRPGGLLVITTGDWASLASRITRSAWRLMTPPQHLFFFSKPTLVRMLGRLGFEVIECSHPWKLVPLSLVVFQLFRMLGLPKRAEPWLGNLGIPVNLFDALRVVARRAE
jgi:SAM-dependent methyltransferase